MTDENEPTRENPRKVREGLVISTKMDKTAIVASTDRVRHRRYAKTMQRTAASRSAFFSASWMSVVICRLKALSTSGRLSVMVSTPSSREYRMVS